MRRKTLVFSAVALLAVAACADQAPTAAPSPDDWSPRLAKGGGPSDPIPPGARFIAGNISGEGDAVCRNIAVNASGQPRGGVKVDPPRSMTIAGYTFTLSPDGRFLSFTRVGPGSGQDVEAVVVKGGPNTLVYDFPGPTAGGTALRAPLNPGGNVPELSHFTVCFTPGPPPPGEHDWTLKKEILGFFFITDDMTGPPRPGSTITLPGNCPGDPAQQGCVLWVKYQITVTKSAGNFPIDASAIVTDDIFERCAELAAESNGLLICQYPDEPGKRPVAVVNLDGSTTWTYFNDIWNRGACGKTYKLTNTAKLTESGPTPPGGEVRTSAATLTINTPPCSRP